MPFDWNTYYELAKDLRLKSDEAYLRSAISRAYYAAYNIAYNHLRERGYTFRRVTHREVWTIYRNKADSDVKSIGINGNRLHDNRKKADYKNKVENLPYIVNVSFIMAERVLTNLAKVKTHSTF